jgi:serine/threonine-protein kinase
MEVATGPKAAAPAPVAESPPPAGKSPKARRPSRPRAPVVRQPERTRAPKPAARKTAPRPTRKTGALTIDTTPWSEVWLGKKKLGTTPLIAVSLPVGTHTLTLKNPERDLNKSYQVTIKEDETTKKRLGLD